MLFPRWRGRAAERAAVAPDRAVQSLSTGLQSALIIGNIGAHLAYVSGASATDTPPRCTTLPDVAAGRNRLQNGIQIFPGSVPIYRGGRLVGGIGVSGDGIDQDDMRSEEHTSEIQSPMRISYADF